MSANITPDTPAMPPPDGLKSNFVDPPDYYALTLGIGTASMVIMVVSVYMRSYTKAIIMKDFRHEDCESNCSVRMRCSSQLVDCAVIALVR